MILDGHLYIFTSPLSFNALWIASSIICTIFCVIILLVLNNLFYDCECIRKVTIFLFFNTADFDFIFI